MSGAQQITFMNQRSFGPPAIGEAFGGGFFAGQISTAGNGIADYNLVVGPVASAQNTSIKWKNVNTAAHFCNDLVIGGFSDWYMPAKNEVEVCYYNLKPTTQSNNETSGINPNAVPARASNYSAGTPAQTSATDFKTAGAERFAGAYYWGSTEVSATNAWLQYFSNGKQYSNYGKSNYSLAVRAVRRVAV